MKLELVTGRHFQVKCKACGAHLIAGSGTETHTRGIQWQADFVYADLNGKPFEAYYCEPCANTMKVLNERNVSGT